MNQISFLHTDIFTDRVCVRFSNVKGDKDQEKFIFDARFVFTRDDEWNKKVLVNRTGLSEDLIAKIPQLFSGKEGAFKECEPLVKQDVERIAREIRLYYERYGNYPDAGDYYVAEMRFREERILQERSRLNLIKLIKACLDKIALVSYRWVSNYGESPSRALLSVLGIWLVPSLLVAPRVNFFDI